MASQWLNADASGTSDIGTFIYLYTPALTEIFVECDVNVCPDLLATIHSGGGPFNFTFDWFELYDLYGQGGLTPVVAPADFWDGDQEGLGLLAFPTGPNRPNWASETAGRFGGPVTAGSYHVKLHMNFADDILVYVIDRVTYDFSGRGEFEFWLSQIDVITFGCVFPLAIPEDIGNVSNIVVGTTGFGVGDVIADDFSSGSISGAWSGTYGPCTVVPTTSCGYAPPPPQTPLSYVFQEYPGFRAA